VWESAQLADDIESSPLIDAVGNVFVHTIGGDVYGLNGVTGATMWHYVVTGSSKNAAAQSSLSLGPDGVLYAAESGTGKVYALVAV
jgi:outer membrane protein assembly factor BamB